MSNIKDLLIAREKIKHKKIDIDKKVKSIFTKTKHDAIIKNTETKIKKLFKNS